MMFFALPMGDGSTVWQIPPLAKFLHRYSALPLTFLNFFPSLSVQLLATTKINYSLSPWDVTAHLQIFENSSHILLLIFIPFRLFMIPESDLQATMQSSFSFLDVMNIFCEAVGFPSRFLSFSINFWFATRQKEGGIIHLFQLGHRAKSVRTECALVMGPYKKSCTISHFLVR